MGDLLSRLSRKFRSESKSRHLDVGILFIHSYNEEGSGEASVYRRIGILECAGRCRGICFISEIRKSMKEGGEAAARAVAVVNQLRARINRAAGQCGCQQHVVQCLQMGAYWATLLNDWK